MVGTAGERLRGWGAARRPLTGEKGSVLKAQGSPVCPATPPPTRRAREAGGLAPDELTDGDLDSLVPVLFAEADEKAHRPRWLVRTPAICAEAWLALGTWG